MTTSFADTGVVKGSLSKCFSDAGSAEHVRLVISGLKASGEQTRRLTGAVSDFEMTVASAFSARLLAQYDSGTLVDGTIIAVKNYQCTEVEDTKKIMVLDLDVVGKYTGADLPKMPVTPVPASSTFDFKTPTPAMPTPPMAFASLQGSNTPPSAASNLPHQPIQSLNPYKSKFTIQVKVDSKQPLKSAVIKGETISILTVVLVDAEGSQIEGTFWREMAEDADKSLKLGSVYYISNGQVGGVNRRYSTTGNDYKINFNQKTVIKAAPDQDACKMTAKCHFVKIDCLEAKIGSKVPVDIVAVVTDVGKLGSIKRKQDDTEFVRRDITIVDDSRKSVMVTLWREQAEKVGAELEALQNPVLVMTKMRVGEFSGVSVSSSYSSHFMVNPTEYPEAAALQQWWDSEGCNQTFAPAGDSVTRPGLQRLSKWQPIEAVSQHKDISISDEPIYASLQCMLTQIPEEQNLYYQANPANNKKVEMNGSGKYVEVGSGDVVDDMRRRYILNAQVMDFTKNLFVNLFNEQAEEMLGMRADELNTIKEDPEQDFSTVLAKPAWSTWTLDVMAKPREYNGKTRMRVNVRSAKRLDYVTDSARLINSIVELCPTEFPNLVAA